MNVESYGGHEVAINSGARSPAVWYSVARTMTTCRALTAKRGDPWPTDPDRFTVGRDAEFVRRGMPTHGLRVWLPKDRHRYLLMVWEGTCAMCAKHDTAPPVRLYEETAAECEALGFKPPKRPVRLD
jgi:hypothetical protein